VQSLVGKRHLLGFREPESGNGAPCQDDWICFLLSDSGVAGHGQVESLAEPGSDLIRDSDQVDRIIRLKNIELYDAPVVSPRSSARQMRSAVARNASGPVLAQVSRIEFEELTRQVRRAERAERV
jgi:hypothetical protein